MSSQTPAVPSVNHIVNGLSAMPYLTTNLKPVYNAKSFTICHRNDSGETDFVFPPNSDIATCVVNCINICRAMLENQIVQNAFTEFAKSYSQIRPTAWFLRETSFERKGDMNRVTDDFLQKILSTFPVVFVDDGSDNRRMVASSFKKPWNETFSSSNQYILLNGSMLHDMVKAAKKANEATDDAERKGYEAFLFIFSHALFHEIGHIFVTYLGQGRQMTPDSLSAPSFSKDPNKGEAGHKLESMIFGGTLEYWWEDPDTETKPNECGAPYLSRASSRWKLLPDTIKRAINCDFVFPYRHEKDEETRKLKALDHDIPMNDFSDPLEYPPFTKSPPPNSSS